MTDKEFDNKILQYLQKLSSEEANRILTDEQNIGYMGYYSLPSNVITDGFGNVYKIPNSGVTSKVTIGNFVLNYDWKNRVINIFSADGKELLDSYGVSASNFIDGPSYWFNQAIDSLQEEIDTSYDIDEFTKYYVTEAYDLYGETIDEEDNAQYTYHIIYEWEPESEDKIPFYNYDDYCDAVTKELLSYNVTEKLIGTDIKISSSIDEMYQNSLDVYSSVPIIKEELLEIFDNFENTMKRRKLLEKSYGGVEFRITDINYTVEVKK